MRLFGKVDGSISRLDRAAWTTPPFDLSWLVIPAFATLPDPAQSTVLPIGVDPHGAVVRALGPWPARGTARPLGTDPAVALALALGLEPARAAVLPAGLESTRTIARRI